MEENFRNEMVKLGDRLDGCLSRMETETSLTLWYCHVYEMELMLWNNKADIIRTLQSVGP